MQTNISVNVDVTADQITPNTAESLQVVLDQSEPVTVFTTGNTIIQGDNLIKVTRKTTTLKALRERSAQIDGEIANLQAQIAELQSEQADLTTTLPLAESQVNKAIADVQAAVVVTPPMQIIN